MAGPILIVGGGLAGLFCALKLAPLPVTVLAAAPIGQGASSAWAQGGIAAAISPGDSPETHTADTLEAGAGIVDREVVLGMTQEAGERIADLLAFGVPFDKDLEGHLIQSREAAHSQRRIVRVRGDKAGQAIMEALVAAVRQTPSITVLEGWIAEELRVEDHRVTGVIARGQGGAAPVPHLFRADAVVLATGGIGHLYAVSTNPPQADGAGVALAALAGAIIADPEFVQFHPTAIDIGRDPAPLATEALRGDGATLINRAGERFMLALHRDGELAPRDIVARGVFAEVQAGRGAYLDCRDAIGAEFAQRFPTVYATCRDAGIDPVTQPIPVVPAEHYHMGGVWSDARGRTSLAGLWAAGEVASTGVHGANRLASNSLLEAVVFADRIARDLATSMPAPSPIPAAPVPVPDGPPPQGADLTLITRLRRVMNDHVGVIRDAKGLDIALREILAVRLAAKSRAIRNMATTALLIAAAARVRHESRGGHYRSDAARPDPAWARRSRLTLAEALAIAETVDNPVAA